MTDNEKLSFDKHTFEITAHRSRISEIPVIKAPPAVHNVEDKSEPMLDCLINHNFYNFW